MKAIQFNFLKHFNENPDDLIAVWYDDVLDEPFLYFLN